MEVLSAADDAAAVRLAAALRDSLRGVLGSGAGGVAGRCAATRGIGLLERVAVEAAASFAAAVAGDIPAAVEAGC